jgi:hypothetical protein
MTASSPSLVLVQAQEQLKGKLGLTPSPGIHDHRQGQRSSSSTLPRAGQPSSPSTCRVHGHRDRRSYTSLASSSATFRPP